LLVTTDRALGAAHRDPAIGVTSPHLVRVALGPAVIDLLQTASIRVDGLAAHRVEVGLLGATDPLGLAYQWTPYRWRALRLRDGTWRGVLPAPALPGVYEVELRIDHSHRLLTSAHWLLSVFPRGTMARLSFPSAVAVARDFVAGLAGHQVLVALRRWPQASFDHRDPRLHRIFVIAYAKRGDTRASSRLGLFLTTVRDGFQARWRLLTATTQPYDQ
jgi:hypothetical protein